LKHLKNGLKQKLNLFSMAKKKHDRQLSKRFNGSDIDKWQELANKETGGNLTLLIELTMNKAVERVSKPS